MRFFEEKCGLFVVCVHLFFETLAFWSIPIIDRINC